LLARIHAEENLFDISGVIDEITQKMLRRHPHVFGDKGCGSTDELRQQWLDIKNQEKGDRD